MWRLLVKQKRRCRLLVGAWWICRQVSSSSCSLGLQHEHVHINMCDPCPCQGISPLQAPAHTAGRQLGSNARACLQRFSHCFTLRGSVKHTHGLLCRLQDPVNGRWSAAEIIVCANRGLSCRETARVGFRRSVLMWADVKRSSQCNANVLFEINAKHVSCPCNRGSLMSRCQER